MKDKAVVTMILSHPRAKRDTDVLLFFLEKGICFWGEWQNTDEEKELIEMLSRMDPLPDVRGGYPLVMVTRREKILGVWANPTDEDLEEVRLLAKGEKKEE